MTRTSSRQVWDIARSDQTNVKRSEPSVPADRRSVIGAAARRSIRPHHSCDPREGKIVERQEFRFIERRNIQHDAVDALSGPRTSANPAAVLGNRCALIRRDRSIVCVRCPR